MRTIRDRLLEGVANGLGHQVVYCDDDDLVHALNAAAASHPAISAWWSSRKEDAAAIAHDLQALRLMASEGGSRAHE
jgi:hypothetical protein